jgi:hypothetical protein
MCYYLCIPLSLIATAKSHYAGTIMNTHHVTKSLNAYKLPTNIHRPACALKYYAINVFMNKHYTYMFLSNTHLLYRLCLKMYRCFAAAATFNIPVNYDYLFKTMQINTILIYNGL